MALHEIGTLATALLPCLTPPLSGGEIISWGYQFQTRIGFSGKRKIPAGESEFFYKAA